jgi:hypothetical protein
MTKANPDSLLQRAQDITGWSDHQLAQIVGIGRSTVQAYRTARLPEYLDGKQVAALRTALELYRDQIAQDVAEWSMFA